MTWDRDSKRWYQGSTAVATHGHKESELEGGWRLIPSSAELTMPIPRSLLDNLKKITPPLDGSLHKGQSGRVGVIGGAQEYALSSLSYPIILNLRRVVTLVHHSSPL